MFSWDSYPKPIVALAPMEGYTDSAYRQMVKRIEPNVLCYTEFSSADAVKYRAKRVLKKLEFHMTEAPLIVQLFGKDPDNFAEAVKIMEKVGVGGIDINMGCPAKKVVASQHGSAMIKNPELAAAMVRAAVKVTKLPISIKTRLGFERADREHFFAFTDELVSAGVSAIAVHGRTSKQGYSGEADWDAIYELKRRHPQIIIIGNGDITSGKVAQERLKNLDGVMIGRATFGNPWIMKEIYATLHGEDYAMPRSFAEKLPTILDHLQLMMDTKGERIGILEMRKHLAVYLKGFEGASQFRSRLVRVSSQQEAIDILDEVADVLK